MITQAYLKECLDYNPETGVFRWRVRPVEHFKTETSWKRWNTRYAGRLIRNIGSRGYLQVQINKRNYMAHRVAWFYVYGVWPVAETDHIDLDRQNNAIANLREASGSQNGGNKRAQRNNTTGFKGVQEWEGRFIAHIQVCKKQYHLGSFSNPEEAHAAYVEAAEKHFGEFARSR